MFLYFNFKILIWLLAVNYFFFVNLPSFRWQSHELGMLWLDWFRLLCCYVTVAVCACWQNSSLLSLGAIVSSYGALFSLFSMAYHLVRWWRQWRCRTTLIYVGVMGAIWTRSWRRMHCTGCAFNQRSHWRLDGGLIVVWFIRHSVLMWCFRCVCCPVRSRFPFGNQGLTMCGLGFDCGETDWSMCLPVAITMH